MRIVAHRGASAREPENTLPAFSLAKSLGANAVELDARVCGSGEVVVFHDETLEKLTDGRGRVAETPLADLRRLKVLGRERIPLLDDVLSSKDRPPAIVIEMKTDGWRDTALAAKVADSIRRTGADAFGPIVVSSFNPLTLQALKSVAPHLPRAMLAEANGPLPLRGLWFAGPVAPREIHLEAPMIHARTVARAHAAGRFVVAWTVNDLATGERLKALGVDGLITDVPDLFTSATPLPARVARA